MYGVTDNEETSLDLKIHARCEGSDNRVIRVQTMVMLVVCVSRQTHYNKKFGSATALSILRRGLRDPVWVWKNSILNLFIAIRSYI